jgi:hypothetical protein
VFFVNVPIGALLAPAAQDALAEPGQAGLAG